MVERVPSKNSRSALLFIVYAPPHNNKIVCKLQEGKSLEFGVC